MIDPRVQALCDEFAIRIVEKHRYPEPDFDAWLKELQQHYGDQS